MITLLSSLARPCSCLYFTKNIHKGGRSENKILLSIDNMSFGRQTDNSVQDQQLPNRSFWKAITILPFRYEDCWVPLTVTLPMAMCCYDSKAVLPSLTEAPHPFTHTGPEHLFCLSFISSRLLGSADLCALTTTLPSSPSLDARNLNT